MNRRTAIKSLAILSALPSLLMEGCSTQTIADLALEIATDSANLATLLGNTSLAAEILKYGQAAQTLILAWKKGSPTQDIVEALNLLEGSLNLIPYVSPYVSLIELAIGAVEGVFAFFGITAPATAPAIQSRLSHPAVHVAPATYKSAAEFRKAWNTAYAKAAIASTPAA